MVGSISLWILLAAALACLSVASGSRARQRQPEGYQERIVEWILEDPNAFFHPAVLFQRLGLGGKSGSYAMHATEDIPKGTPLIVVPRNYIIESHMKKSRAATADHQDDFRMCITVEKMLEEYYKHTDPQTTFQSFYAPYLSYLFEDAVGGTTRGLLPGTWSEHSKALMSLILDPDEEDVFRLRPIELEYNSIYDICEGNVDNGGETMGFSNGILRGENDEDSFVSEQMAEDAYLFLLSRGWNDKLVPLIDMLNHVNGPNRNVEVTPIDDIRMNDVAAYAWRDIQKGEQLQYSYSECMDETCGYGEWRYYTSTQYMFVEYGFVEAYPRRWIFDIENEEGGYDNLFCEVTTDPKNNSKLIFQWIFDEPSEEDIAWIQDHLNRLKSIEPLIKEGLEELEASFESNTWHNLRHERDTILDYYEAYVEAFQLAIEHKDDPVGVTDESFEQEVLELKRSVGIDTKTMGEIRLHEVLSTARDSQRNKEQTTMGGAASEEL